MTIRTNVPTSIRRPGAYHEFIWNAKAQGLVPVDARLVVVAEKTAAGTAVADTPVRVYDEAQSELLFGVGSFADLGVKKAFAQGDLNGGASPEIWVCPVVENAAGVAMQTTITFTGPATESKTLYFTIAGRLIDVGVTAGDSAATIATATKNRIDALASNLPVTAAVVGAVVTCTARTKGVNGNDITFALIERPAGTTCVFAQSVAGTGATAITNALAALYDQDYHLIAHSNHAVGDAATIIADSSLGWGFAQKNYRFHCLGERGSLGTAQTLQASYNDYRTLIGSCEGTPSLPVEISVAIGCAWWAQANPNANLNWYRVALYPPSAPLAYTVSEIESALASGLIPLTPDGAFLKIERLVTSQITSGGVPFEPLRDAAYPRTAAYVAKQLDAGFIGGGFHQEVMYRDPDGGDDVFSRIRDMVIDKHRAMERLRILRDVDSFLERIQAVEAGAPAGRVIIADPFRVAGPLCQGVFVHSMYQ